MNNEIRNLIDKLNYYTKLYDEGKPEISDKNGIIFVEYQMEERIKEKQYEQKEEI